MALVKKGKNEKTTIIFVQPWSDKWWSLKPVKKWTCWPLDFKKAVPTVVLFIRFFEKVSKVSSLTRWSSVSIWSTSIQLEKITWTIFKHFRVVIVMKIYCYVDKIFSLQIFGRRTGLHGSTRSRLFFDLNLKNIYFHSKLLDCSRFYDSYYFNKYCKNNTH